MVTRRRSSRRGRRRCLRRSRLARARDGFLLSLSQSVSLSLSLSPCVYGVARQVRSHYQRCKRVHGDTAKCTQTRNQQSVRARVRACIPPERACGRFLDQELKWSSPASGQDLISQVLTLARARGGHLEGKSPIGRSSAGESPGIICFASRANKHTK